MVVRFAGLAGFGQTSKVPCNDRQVHMRHTFEYSDNGVIALELLKKTRTFRVLQIVTCTENRCQLGQVFLGHHSPAFTLATYVHLLDEDAPDVSFFDATAGVPSIVRSPQGLDRSTSLADSTLGFVGGHGREEAFASARLAT